MTSDWNESMERLNAKLDSLWQSLEHELAHPEKHAPRVERPWWYRRRDGDLPEIARADSMRWVRP